MRVAIDIGGTFTDLVALDGETGEVVAAKAGTTPWRLAEGVAAAMDHLGSKAVDLWVHGSTVVINALLQRKGARTALITTKGFRDVLEIGRTQRPDLYNLLYQKPRPFVPRRWRFEVAERISAAGEEVLPLSREDLQAALWAMDREGIEAVAIAFLNSYANPQHEEEAAQLLRSLAPQLRVTLSSALTRQWREYERTSTAVLNAYVQPVVDVYLRELTGLLDELNVSPKRYLFQSSAGIMDLSEAADRPIHLVESGPVGGVMGAAYLAKALHVQQAVTLDVGGTTAKAALILGGEPQWIDEYAIEKTGRQPGYPILIPTVDIVEVGAGGGSMAYRDATGAVRVGPESAGADPGPVAYGRGGTHPTVTDAQLYAGHLAPGPFLGGQLFQGLSQVEGTLAALGAPEGLEAKAVAQGIIRLAQTHMAHALEMVSLRRGLDPRLFHLMAFGGGGGLHAGALLKVIPFKEALIPLHPGVFSAWGMLTAPLKRTWSQTFLQPVAGHEGSWSDRFRTLTDLARSWLRAQGFGDDGQRVRCFWDLRYRGQEHTVRVPVNLGDLQATLTLFHEAHRRTYGFALDQEVEGVHLHAVAQADLSPLPLTPWRRGQARPQPRAFREVLWQGKEPLATPLYWREDLPAGWETAGPAVIEEPSGSTLLWPGQKLAVDPLGILHLWEGR
ncbi:MAG: hydantoinase/oxoprolinase family protein [Bacillota bacterium]|nr:hydantoinase/oxoprolinase family protein [Bacillota bacterium]